MSLIATLSLVMHMQLFDFLGSLYVKYLHSIDVSIGFRIGGKGEGEQGFSICRGTKFRAPAWMGSGRRNLGLLAAAHRPRIAVVVFVVLDQAAIHHNSWPRKIRVKGIGGR